MVLKTSYYNTLNTTKNVAYVLILKKLFSVKVLKKWILIGIEWYWKALFWYWMVLNIIHYTTFNTTRNIAYILILSKLLSVKVKKILKLLGIEW